MSYCQHCGYSLRGLPFGGKCPECGHWASSTKPPSLWPTACMAAAVLVTLVVPLQYCHSVESQIIRSSTESIGFVWAGLGILIQVLFSIFWFQARADYARRRSDRIALAVYTYLPIAALTAACVLVYRVYFSA